MKSRIALLLALLLLMAGCSTPGTPTSSTQPSAPTSPQTTPASTPPTETTQPTPKLSLMDSRIPAGQLGNSWYIPNEAIEGMSSPQICMFGNALLLNSYVIDSNTGCMAILRLVSLEDGSLIAETTFPSSGYITIQAKGERIGICDSGNGQVRLLGPQLDILNTYTLEADSGNWYLSQDMRTLYQFNWQEGILARELASGVQGTLLSNATEVYVRDHCQDDIIFSYVDTKSQKTMCQSLSLKNGTLEKLPVEGDVLTAAHTHNAWLIGDSAQQGMYRLMANGQRKIAVWQDNRLELLPQAYLLTLDAASRNFNLYDLEGRFLSTCQLPEGQQNFVGQDIIWSDLWGGYFFIDYQGSQAGKLTFWDIQLQTTGQDFPLKAEDSTMGGTSAAPELYNRARALSQRFGVDIRIADQCSCNYAYFDAYSVNDAGFIGSALDTLERALSVYPQGFFQQLCYGNIQRLQIELVGGLCPKQSSLYSDAYGGFASEQSDHYLIVLDLYMMHEGSVYHEITHVMDARLAWDAKLRENALFSEERWLSLQPEGFVYANTYAQMPDSAAQFANSGYFVSDYSCRFAAEDRATMMEAAMHNGFYTYFANPHLYEKLDYYSRCIRDCFDTTGWPQVTAWEERLQNRT
nr:hypothetical protein [bacterium]